VRDLKAARVILRLVLMALHAEKNGSVVADHDDELSRWSAAINAALARLCSVRDLLMETPESPPIDWPTPFALVNALDSAFWDSTCSNSRRTGTTAPDLTSLEAQTALLVVIDSIDEVLDACDITPPGVVKIA
jgi:hypothetical protein